MTKVWFYSLIEIQRRQQDIITSKVHDEFNEKDQQKYHVELKIIR